MNDLIIYSALCIALVALVTRKAPPVEGVDLSRPKKLFINFQHSATSMTAIGHRHIDGLWYVAMREQPGMKIEVLHDNR